MFFFFWNERHFSPHRIQFYFYCYPLNFLIVFHLHLLIALLIAICILFAIRRHIFRIHCLHCYVVTTGRPVWELKQDLVLSLSQLYLYALSDCENEEMASLTSVLGGRGVGQCLMASRCILLHLYCNAHLAESIYLGIYREMKNIQPVVQCKAGETGYFL